jgi:hypothetical protein
MFNINSVTGQVDGTSTLPSETGRQAEVSGIPGNNVLIAANAAAGTPEEKANYGVAQNQANLDENYFTTTENLADAGPTPPAA